MSVLNNGINLLLAADAAAPSGYQISRSLRFNQGDTSFLNRTPASAGNRTTWTWSGWVKRAALSTAQWLFFSSDLTANTTGAYFTASDTLEFYEFQSGSYVARLITTQVFRDPSSWYHFAFTWDTDNGTSANRLRIYVNGTRIETFSTASYPASGTQSRWNSNVLHYVGRGVGSEYLSAYLGECFFLDGIATDPTSFTTTDSNGELQPIAYTGNYGLVPVTAATGALPIFNTTGPYGTVKGSGTRTDTNSAYISLALPMDGSIGGTSFGDQSATIKGSGSAKTVTVTNATTSITQSKFYGSSGFFNNTAYLRVPYSSDIDLASIDFTVETFVYKTTSDEDQIVDFRGNGATGWAMYIKTNGTIQIYDTNAGTQIGTSSGAVPLNTWAHIALTRNGTGSNNCTFWINGVNAGTFTYSNFAATNSGGLGIACDSSNGANLTGYLQDLRIYKGIAKYTSAFSPVTGPNNSFYLPFSDNATAAALGTDTSGSAAPTVANGTGGLPIFNTTDTYGTVKGSGTRADTSASSLSLCVPMGTASGLSLTDEQPTGRTSSSATLANTGVTNSTSVSKFYGGSALFSSSRLDTTATSDFLFGTGDFTVEGWFYQTTANSYPFALEIGDHLSSNGIGFITKVTGPETVSIYSGGFYGSAPVALNVWNHIVWMRASGVLKIYVNGILSSSDTFTNNLTSTTGNVTIGAKHGGDAAYYFSGYMQDFRVYKGLAKYTSNFNPPASPNNWTVNNFSITAGSGNDSLTDTPTSYGTSTGVGGEVRGNYCTLNPLDSGGGTVSNGNLEHTYNSSYLRVKSTISIPATGKWYAEFVASNAGAGNSLVGIATGASSLTGTNWYLGNDAGSWGLQIGSGTMYTYHNGAFSSFGTANNGDVIGVAVDRAAGKIWWSVNNTWIASGDPANGTNARYSNVPATDTLFFALSNANSASIVCNWGQRAFAYTAPTGFKALVDTNLPTPTIAKGNTAMDVKLYTGNGGTQTFTGLNLSPDFIWMKRRDAARSHALYDVVRGVKKYLASDSTSAEYEPASGGVTAFNSDGFTIVEQGGVAINEGSASMVGWVWDAGSSTVTNTAGSITSQVRVNASAGFSIVTYTGTGANATVGHGLGVAPSFIIGKSRSATQVWPVGHTSIGWINYLLLNASDASAPGTNVWNSTNPSSTVVSLGSGAGLNASGSNDVMYCFAPVSGYSSVSSYLGNGSSDGPFQWCGFRPRFILLKSTSGSRDWLIYDTARGLYNPQAEGPLQPNTSGTPYGFSGYDGIDILSNGFKLRTGINNLNASGETHIFMAFAENPFQYARAR